MPYKRNFNYYITTKHMQNNRIRVGITHGDINGIGYETILKMLEDEEMLDLCTPVIYGSAKIASFYRKILNLPVVTFTQVPSGADIVDGAINIINVVPEDTKVDPGVSTPVAGQAAFAALERAVADLKEGYIQAMVTCPINKHNIQSETFHFPGHTEYLEAAAGEDNKALMVLCNDTMRVALVTTHVPVKDIAPSISQELILEKLTIFHRALMRDYGIDAPRIAVLALNPHAGDGGLLGNEEKGIIVPAIETAQKQGILAFGPYAADGFFGAGQFEKFDGVLAMYHDQGLAPFKALSMDSGVNYTAGLPFVRTSPDHGTAYDIAGKGLASPGSLRAAVFMAIDIWRSRKREEECHRHPLRKQYVAKGNDNVVLDLTKD